MLIPVANPKSMLSMQELCLLIQYVVVKVKKNTICRVVNACVLPLPSLRNFWYDRMVAVENSCI